MDNEAIPWRPIKASNKQTSVKKHLSDISSLSVIRIDFLHQYGTVYFSLLKRWEVMGGCFCVKSCMKENTTPFLQRTGWFSLCCKIYSRRGLESYTGYI